MAEPRGRAGWTAIAVLVALSLLALAGQYLQRYPRPLLLPRPAPMARPDVPVVRLWLSTADRRLQLAQQPDLALAASGSEHADVVVDTHRRYQSIVGFGAALTDASAWLLQNRMTEQQRSALLHEMFGPPPNLNLGMTRLSIGASDFSLQHYSLDDLPRGGSDPGLLHFNVAANLRDVIPTVREALAVNPQLRILAAPWSAPAWMKTSNSLIGGTLLEQYESAYADYLVRYVEAYRSYGIPIYALSIQNEPGFAPKTYPGMTLSAEQRASIIGQYLGPALAGLKPKVRILGWDHNWDAPEQPLNVLADPDAARYIDGIAWHCYAGSPYAQGQVHRAYPGKDTFITECSGGDWESARHGELLLFADNVILAGLRQWARGVVYWNLVLDERHGPHAGGCELCKGMLTLDTRTGTLSRNDEYYAFAHYSRFVLPGAVRVWSTETGHGLDNVAFANADGGPLVLVMVNTRTAPRHVTVRQGQAGFQYTLPPQSVATFEWEPARADGDGREAAPPDAPDEPDAAD